MSKVRKADKLQLIVKRSVAKLPVAAKAAGMVLGVGFSLPMKAKRTALMGYSLQKVAPALPALWIPAFAGMTGPP